MQDLFRVLRGSTARGFVALTGVTLATGALFTGAPAMASADAAPFHVSPAARLAVLQPAAGQPTSQQSPQSTPDAQARACVERMTSRGLDIARASDMDLRGQRQALETLLLESVDLPWVGRFVLGIHWRRATPEQQERFLQLYPAFMVRTYTDQLKQYAGTSSTINGARQERPGEYLVFSTVRAPKAPPLTVDYRVRVGSADGNAPACQVFDIVVEGVSLLATQRDEFSSVINRRGMPYLLDRLEQRVRESDASGR